MIATITNIWYFAWSMLVNRSYYFLSLLFILGLTLNLTATPLYFYIIDKQGIIANSRIQLSDYGFSEPKGEYQSNSFKITNLSAVFRR